MPRPKPSEYFETVADKLLTGVFHRKIERCPAHLRAELSDALLLAYREMPTTAITATTRSDQTIRAADLRKAQKDRDAMRMQAKGIKRQRDDLTEQVKELKETHKDQCQQLSKTHMEEADHLKTIIRDLKKDIRQLNALVASADLRANGHMLPKLPDDTPDDSHELMGRKILRYMHKHSCDMTTAAVHFQLPPARANEYIFDYRRSVRTKWEN